MIVLPSNSLFDKDFRKQFCFGFFDKRTRGSFFHVLRSPWIRSLFHGNLHRLGLLESTDSFFTSPQTLSSRDSENLLQYLSFLRVVGKLPSPHPRQVLCALRCLPASSSSRPPNVSGTNWFLGVSRSPNNKIWEVRTLKHYKFRHLPKGLGNGDR